MDCKLTIDTKVAYAGQARKYYRYVCSCGEQGGFRCTRKEAEADWQSHVYPALRSRIATLETQLEQARAALEEAIQNCAYTPTTGICDHCTAFQDYRVCVIHRTLQALREGATKENQMDAITREAMELLTANCPKRKCHVDDMECMFLGLCRALGRQALREGGEDA